MCFYGENKFMCKKFFFIVIFFILQLTNSSFAMDRYFLQGYGGRFADMSLEKFFTETERITHFKTASMLSLGAGFENYYFDKIISIGAEINSAYHWGYESQQFAEFSSALFIRLNKFPWSWKIPKSISVGDGISYATEYPAYEYDYGGTYDNRLNEKLLNFLFIEAAFDITDDVELFARLHHRCVAWGAFGPPPGGVTFPAIGLRYSF